MTEKLPTRLDQTPADRGPGLTRKTGLYGPEHWWLSPYRRTHFYINGVHSNRTKDWNYPLYGFKNRIKCMNFDSFQRITRNDVLKLKFRAYKGLKLRRPVCVIWSASSSLMGNISIEDKRTFSNLNTRWLIIAKMVGPTRKAIWGKETGGSFPDHTPPLRQC